MTLEPVEHQLAEVLMQFTGLVMWLHQVVPERETPDEIQNKVEELYDLIIAAIRRNE